MLKAQSQAPVAIGNTTYDFQTYSANNNHIIAYPDGKVSAAWMGSDGFGASFTDLGTFFNHYNGSVWGSFPTGRVEGGVKTYSTEILRVMDHELILADDVSKLRLYENTSIGGTTWSEPAGSHVLDQWYNMTYCPAGTDDIYVVGQKPNAEDLLFSRSDNGGDSWAVTEYALPFTTEAYGCDLVLPGTYQIVAKGNDVYVLYGSLISDLILMHSGSKGDAGTWELEATILDFPIDNYIAGAGETTDWDGDGDYDWLDTNDGMHEMFISDDGTVHVFTGRMQIRDVAGVTGFYYDYEKGGIYHWKTGDASATLHEEFIINWNGTGDDFDGITANSNAYSYESFTCMPSAAYDEDINRIYLSFMMPVEDEISASGQNYYDLFGTYSDDDGETWSPPINLTYTAHAGRENAYPCAYAKIVNNKFHVQWQEDDEPGTSQDQAPDDDDIQTNNILFAAWDSTRFQPYDPTVDFNYSIAVAGVNYNVTFTNLSFDAESYFWEFGDGATSTLTNPTHIYAEGNYEVCLTATNVYGDATACEDILVSIIPNADLSFTGDPTVVFTDVSTGGNATSWLWDFDDGITSAIENPVHTYAVNGTYGVCLTVSNLAGSDTQCENVIIDSYVTPVAYFTFSGDPTVLFDDASTGSPIEWDWDFDDGGTSTLTNPTHTFLANGTYNVCLTVTNAYGPNTYCTDVVIDAYPEAAFSYLDADPLISFFDESWGSPSDWDWDFGDGGSSTFENPVHAYAENGTYSVCLTVTNAYGESTICEDVVIDSYIAPGVAFSYTGDPDVDFTDLSSGGPFAWDWDFGDGGSSTLQNPSHTFGTNGSFNVCLTATNDLGFATGCETVIINGYFAPEALFTYSGDPDVTFEDLSTNDPTSWLWDFGDGDFSTIQNPVHLFDENGTYLVCLTVIGPGGSDTYCDNLDIELSELAPVADFSWSASGVLTIHFNDLSTNDPSIWEWDFGDGSISPLQNPTHTYATAGNYNVCLTATNGVGSNESCEGILVSSIQNALISVANVFPNPASNFIVIETDASLTEYNLRLTNLIGQEVAPENMQMGTDHTIHLNITNLPAGTYLVTIFTQTEIYFCEFIKEQIILYRF